MRGGWGCWCRVRGLEAGMIGGLRAGFRRPINVARTC